MSIPLSARVPCQHGWRLLLLLLAAFPLLAVEPSPGFQIDQVPRFGGHETVVLNSGAYANPFDYTEIELRGVFIAPDGRQQTVYGFYDGDGSGSQSGQVWRLRHMPDQPGAWTYTWSWTGSSASKPAGGAGAYTCVESELRGPLAIDATTGWHLVDGRGQPFHHRPYDMHYLGYKCNLTGWSDAYFADMQWATGDVVGWYQQLVPTLVEDRGYNSVCLSSPTALASWKRLKNASGDPVGLPRTWWWNNDTSLDVFDIQVCREYDRLLAWLRDRGIYAFTFFHLGGEKGSASRQLGRYLGARQGVFANFWGYCPAWETASNAGYQGAMEMIRDSIPYPAILASQTSSPATSTPWVKAHFRQVHAGITLATCNRRDWDGFIFGDEDTWEGFYGGRTAMRVSAWASLLASVVPNYFDLHTQGGVAYGQGLAEEDLRRMFDWWYARIDYRHPDFRMRNALTGGDLPDVRTSGIPGRQLVTYHLTGETVTIDLSDSSATWAVSWFDPITGSRHDDVAQVAGGATRTLTAPFSGEKVLLLETGGGGNTAPVITAPASASGQTPTTVDLSVGASDADGDSLSYTWTASAKPPGAAPSIPSGASTTATFDRAGSYTLTVTVSDGRGGSISSLVEVSMEQVGSDLQIAP